MTNNNIREFFANSVQSIAVDRFFQLLQHELNEKTHSLHEAHEKQKAFQLEIAQLVRQQQSLNEQLQKQKQKNSMQKQIDLESINDIEILNNLAKQGDVDAQNKLASAYYMTAQFIQKKESTTAYMGMFSELNKALKPKDYYIKAHTWYLKAAVQNSASAQCHLGFMYYSGHGVTVDNNEASQWYLKAVANGSVQAHCHLGRMFQEAGNYKKAAEWYLSAIKLGNKDALGYYQVLQNYL